MKSSLQQAESLQTVLDAVGIKLRHLRKDMGYVSHVDFASDHGLSPIQYWRLEKGRANPTFKSLHRVLAIHGLTFSELFNAISQDGSKARSASKRRKR